ncbi:Hint domain-containing protein [Phaeobacter sp. BS52]|uniref:Hint domain-containing protein n=1 Tax=Phaeobacter sp. BS52 TaxID=2907241 RepID=UPI00386B0E1A
MPCFTPGTTIATPYGACAVEDLSVGDRVMTRDNGLQPIRWIGQRQLDRTALQGAAHLQPVLVAEGALGNGMPQRDLLLSPNHRVLITNDKTAFYFEGREILVAAKHLTGLSGVDAVETSSIDYIHFVCAGHEVVCADGAWIECFQLSRSIPARIGPGPAGGGADAVSRVAGAAIRHGNISGWLSARWQRRGAVVHPLRRILLFCRR